MSSKNFPSKCPIKISHQNVSLNCLLKMYHQVVSSKCFIKMIHQNISSKCLIKTYLLQQLCQLKYSNVIIAKNLCRHPGRLAYTLAGHTNGYMNSLANLAPIRLPYLPESTSLHHQFPNLKYCSIRAKIVFIVVCIAENIYIGF